MSRARILVVEDEAKTAETPQTDLATTGLDVEQVALGRIVTVARVGCRRETHDDAG